MDLGADEWARAIGGTHSENLRHLERQLGVRIGQRGTELLLGGSVEATGLAARVLAELSALARSGRTIYPEDIDQVIQVLALDGRPQEVMETVLSRSGRQIGPKGIAQKRYVDAIRSLDVVFGIGPAGTGKTYLAMAMAVAALQARAVKRIVLARPAVEAGEKLGFLPGDLAEKVNPYLRPLYDALHDMMDVSRAHDLIEQGTIEVAPLAFMRGRTLHDAFAILDEAQNTTIEQMKMFLTRLGCRSKAVVTGDVTQVDLPPGATSGLVHARSVLDGVEGIAFCHLSEVDVVRHPLVRSIVRAYARPDR